MVEYFSGKTALFDTIVSTYVAHHLTESKKHSSNMQKAALKPGELAGCADLVCESKSVECGNIEQCREADKMDTAKAIIEGVSWRMNEAGHYWGELGFAVQAVRFPDLSWGIKAQKR